MDPQQIKTLIEQGLEGASASVDMAAISRRLLSMMHSTASRCWNSIRWFIRLWATI